MGDPGDEVRFTGVLAEAQGAGGRWVEVPFDPKRTFGEARAPVRGTVNGTPALDADASAARVFDGLSFTHRREYAQWIGEAKRESTRRTRAEKAVAMLREGTRHP